MTGHSINAEQNKDFLSTMHTMIDDLDTISSNIDEHTYLRLVNGLQRLYNIHNSGTSNNQNSANRQQEIGIQENNVAQNITGALVRHYERVNDISGVHINAYPVNAGAYPVNANAYSVNSIINSTIANVNVNAYDNVNYDSWNENNPAQNQESARISYTSLYANANDYWNQALFRQFQENIRAH